jgi:DNA adenine methylase
MMAPFASSSDEGLYRQDRRYSRTAGFDDVGRTRQLRRAGPLTHTPFSTILLAMRYPGGKNAPGVYHTIINQMPPHDTYVEPFLGSGAILRLKRAAAIANIGVDLDEGPIAKFSDAAGVTAICGDGIRYLQERQWRLEELVYADPPYLMSSRRQTRPIYKFEMDERQHIELLGTLKAIPAMVIISGYPSPLYDAMLERWRKVTFTAMTRGGVLATECLWMNFPEPEALHDYRFIGKGFRERERIKRKIDRWTTKLKAMKPQERIALSGALAGFAEGGSAIARPGATGSLGDARSVLVKIADGSS